MTSAAFAPNAVHGFSVERLNTGQGITASSLDESALIQAETEYVDFRRAAVGSHGSELADV
jgi:hypothetical protein